MGRQLHVFSDRIYLPQSTIFSPSIYHHIPQLFIKTFHRPPSIPINYHQTTIKLPSSHQLQSTIAIDLPSSSHHHHHINIPQLLFHRSTIKLPSAPRTSCKTSHQTSHTFSIVAAVEMEKRSRYKPLKTEEAWDRIFEASENLKVLGRLSDAEAQRSSEALDTLKMVQPSGKLKRYKEFLYDVLCNSGPQFVLLCAVALGQVRVANMKKGDRVGLISNIKANKDNTGINHSTVRSLAIRYHIPNSVTGVFSPSF